MRAQLLGLLVVGLVGGLLAGCGGSDDRSADPEPSPMPSPTAIPDRLAIDADDTNVHPRQVLALVPADAEALTLSNFDQTRDRFGNPDLTSDSPVSERTAFAERARTDAPLFTDGLFADNASLFWLDYGFTQDDVDWEARFTGPDGPGYVLSFRPGQDMEEVRRAVADRAGPLDADARLLADQRLLVSGIAAEGEPVLASRPEIPPLLEADVEAAYLRTSCIPLEEALGPEAGSAEQQQLLDAYDVTALRPLGPFAVNFLDGIGTARLSPERPGDERPDLHDRVGLIDPWPDTGTLTWAEGFRGLPVADPSTGRVGLQVKNPRGAASLVLDDHLPFAVCNEVTPVPEPTGP